MKAILKKNKMQKNATSKNHENGIKMALFNLFEIYEYFRAFPKKIWYMYPHISAYTHKYVYIHVGVHVYICPWTAFKMKGPLYCVKVGWVLCQLPNRWLRVCKPPVCWPQIGGSRSKTGDPESLCAQWVVHQHQNRWLIDCKPSNL